MRWSLSSSYIIFSFSPTTEQPPPGETRQGRGERRCRSSTLRYQPMRAARARGTAEVGGGPVHSSLCPRRRARSEYLSICTCERALARLCVTSHCIFPVLVSWTRRRRRRGGATWKATGRAMCGTAYPSRIGAGAARIASQRRARRSQASSRGKSLRPRGRSARSTFGIASSCGIPSVAFYRR